MLTANYEQSDQQLNYQVDDITFDYDPDKLIHFYTSKIKNYGFHNNHPFIKFTHIEDEVKGLYDTNPYPIISLTNSKIENPLKILFHELGHHLYSKFTDDVKNQIKEYIDKNIKWVKNPIKFLKKCKKYNLRKLSISNIKLYNLICLVLGNIFEEENSLYNSIPTLTITSQIKAGGPIQIHSKLESLYSIDYEEIFCETFAAYMNKTCMFKSNISFIENIISQI